MPTARAALAFLVAVALLAGIPNPGTAVAGEVRITIRNLAFEPAEATVHVGDTVIWVNIDFIDHTATATDGAWDVAIAAGKSASLNPANAGTFSYYCRVHPGMTGTLHVVDK